MFLAFREVRLTDLGSEHSLFPSELRTERLMSLGVLCWITLAKLSNAKLKCGLRYFAYSMLANDLCSFKSLMEKL